MISKFLTNTPLDVSPDIKEMATVLKVHCIRDVSPDIKEMATVLKVHCIRDDLMKKARDEDYAGIMFVKEGYYETGEWVHLGVMRGNQLTEFLALMCTRGDYGLKVEDYTGPLPSPN